jgi:hypothetical protein
MSNRALPQVGILALVFILSACGGEKPQASQTSSGPAAASDAVAAAPSVTILEPQDGAEVQGPAVHVRLTAQGVRIVPAGDTTPGTGHHHLYLDADLGDPNKPIPAVPGHIIHLGTGVSEYTFDSVAPGPHRLIAAVADGLHVPLQPWVVDTVRFTVR